MQGHLYRIFDKCPQIQLKKVANKKADGQVLDIPVQRVSGVSYVSVSVIHRISMISKISRVS